ncbi:MAG: hypothetical protein ABIK92_13665 [Pseudomonadota bacterium]
MNILMQQINESMFELTESKGGITARFIFLPEFTGFKGHFPDRPILPGVCKIQSVIAMLEKYHGKKICLTEILLAKFVASVTVNQEIIIVSTKINEEVKESKIKASVTSGDTKVAEIQLKVSLV